MLKPPLISLCIGKRGGGKSTLTKTIIKSNPRFCIYDYHAEYDYKEFQAVPVYTFDDLKKLLREGEDRIIFKPKRNTIATFEFFCAINWHYNHDSMIIIEEINRVLPTGRSEYSGELIDNGRHKNLGMHACCRRPFGINMDFMGQVDCFFIGKINELIVDKSFMQNFLPDGSWEKIMQLPRYNFLRFFPEPERLGLNESQTLKIVSNQNPLTLQ
jgi:hypothetical protein